MAFRKWCRSGAALGGEVLLLSPHRDRGLGSWRALFMAAATRAGKVCSSCRLCEPESWSLALPPSRSCFLWIFTVISTLYMSWVRAGSFL